MTAASILYRRNIQSTEYVPRRNTETNQIDWFNEATLLRGVEKARTYCTHGPNIPPSFVPNSILTEDLDGGVPCPKCNDRWPLPTTSAKS